MRIIMCESYLEYCHIHIDNVSVCSTLWAGRMENLASHMWWDRGTVPKYVSPSITQYFVGLLITNPQYCYIYQIGIVTTNKVLLMSYSEHKVLRFCVV